MTTTILLLQCKLNSDAQHGEEGTNVEETGNPARGRIKVKGGCTLLSPPNLTLRGYSGGKDKTRTTGDLETKRVAACCQRSTTAGNCQTLARRAGLDLEIHS